jgi:hypothetical protein
MGFLPPGQSFRSAFYPGRQAAGNKATGGFFGTALPSRFWGQSVSSQ